MAGILSPHNAQAQVALAQFGDQGDFKSMKQTEIDGTIYTAVLFGSRLYLLSHAGEVVANTAITEGRALATSGDSIFVFGKTGSTSKYELLKYEVDLAGKKFKAVLSAGLPAFYHQNFSGGRIYSEEVFGGVSNRPFVRRTIDMTVTTKAADGSPDLRVWLAFNHRDGTILELMRFSHGEAGVAPKYDDITLSENYVEPQAKHYRFMDTANSVLKLRTLETTNVGSTHRFVMETDPDGKSFWLAVPQGLTSQNTTYSVRVARIERREGFQLFCADAGSHTDGGLDLAQSGTNSSSSLIGGLAVTENHVYITCWTRTGKSLLYRIPRVAFTTSHSGSISQLPPDTLIATVQHPSGQDTGTAKINALVVDRSERVTVAGAFDNHDLNFGYSVGSGVRVMQSVANHNMFVASLDPKFRWDVLSVVPQVYEGGQPRFDYEQIGLTKTNTDGSNLLLAAKFSGSGSAKFDNVTYGGDKNAFSVLLSSRNLSYAQKRFDLLVTAKFKAPNSDSEQNLKLPEVGGASGDEGESKTITLPANLYQRRDGSFVDLSRKSQAEIEAEVSSPDVIARYRTTGYTVTRQGENQSEVGTGNSATVLMTKNTNITFNLERDFALDISSNLNGLPNLDPKSSQSIGSPQPAAGRHWVKDSEIMNPLITRESYSPLNLGTRYLATGYSISGVPNRTGGTFSVGAQNGSVEQFAMTGPVSITYSWKAQHSVTVAVSQAGAANSTAILPTGGTAESTTGVHWFDRNTEITVGAGDGAFQVKGVFLATGALASINQADRGDLKDTFVLNGGFYRGKKITLQDSGQITWDYGDPSYMQVVSIGSPVRLETGGIGFDSGDTLTSAAIASINRSVAPKVTVVSARSDTTGDNAFVWSTSEQKAYPVRPGVFSLRFSLIGQGELEMLIVAGFPGDTVSHPRLATPGIKFPGNPRDLRAVVHPDMPGIELDPSAEDDTAFRSLAYSEAAVGAVGAVFPAAPNAAPQIAGSGAKVMDFDVRDGGNLAVEGRHVLVFSRSTTGLAATGDLGKESALVRILETRPWNAPKKWETSAAGNRVLSFGSAGYVKTSLTSLAGDNLTIQFWFAGSDPKSAVRQQNGAESIQVPGDGRRFAVPGTSSSIYGPQSLESGQWKHIAMVYRRNGGLAVYVDGTLYQSVSAPDLPLPNLNTEVLFGAAFREFYQPEYTRGKIDEISIWNRALSDSEIRNFQSTKAQLTGAETGLVGYWNFDQETAQDLSPNQHHGVLVGTASIVAEKELLPLAPLDDTGEAMIALEKATSNSPGTPVPAEIGKQLRDRLDLAGIGTGFVTGRLAPFNINLHDRGASAQAGPIFPVNLSQKNDENHDLTVIWYERRDGVLWPWRPRRYAPVWPNTKNRIVIASQLGSDGLNSDRVTQQKFDPAVVDDLAVYVQNDRARAGYNPNEEHALVAASLRYGAEQPAPAAVYALRNDLNKSQDPDPLKNTSPPFVLAQFTDTTTGSPQMAVYKVEREDQSVKAFNAPDGWIELRGNSGITRDSGGEILFRMPAIKLYDGEAIRIRFLSGSIAGLRSDQVVYPIFYGPAFDFRIATTPGGAPLTTADAVASTVILQVQRMHPYIFDYPAMAGQPVPVPNPLSNVIGAVPPPQISGSDIATGGTVVPRVFYKDYKGTSWVVSGGGARFSVDFYYRIQEGFWTSDKPEDQLPINSPVQWHPTGRTFYTASWPSEVPVLKAGETLTFSGGEYKSDRPDQPGLPGVIGWAAGRIVFDSRTPAMDRGVSIEQQEAPFKDYTARLIAPLETRFVSLLDQGMSSAEIATFKERISPATGVVSVDGALWRFQKLPASLRDRLYFDPIENRLGMVGYVNGKTLGDRTLTASPDPAYILDPNILSADDLALLKSFKGDTADLKTMGDIIGDTARWNNLMDALYKKTRNPDSLKRNVSDTGADNYYTGLTWAPQRDAVGNILRYDAAGKAPAGASLANIPTGYTGLPGKPVPMQYRAAPAPLKGPGLALVASPKMLDPSIPEGDYYVTLAENDDADLGLPVTLHIIKVNPKHRFRGALKLVEGDNAFSEKVTLRHTADFGANTNDLEFQWFYRPEDGRSVPVPYNGGSSSAGAWQLFPGVKGGQINFDAEGRFILPDLWFISRYRHVGDTDGSQSWANTRWSRDGKPDSGLKVGELWAGGANSPQPNGTYLAQLLPGWLKRVLDRINPYEARFNDFRNNGAPATYASMIQQAGPAYNGPVALNTNKDVVENVGLIQLYQTLLERGKGFAFASDITDPALKSGVMNALQFAATRVQDLYVVLGNEAYADSQDPLIGFGSDSAEYGTTATGIWTFMNQTTDLLEEELGLLRGQSFSFGSPVHNRLFWNFTKDMGEVAYVQTYNINDENRDGFINESDARLLYPMGHGDAWGHYSTAVKMHYDLLREPNFLWQPRSEFYSLLNTVVPVDFLDERKFAAASAARVRAGADIVKLTYRQRYTEDPDGQWQGYADVDVDRAWGVEGWARRAGQAALLDWAVGNSMVPASVANRGEKLPVTGISIIAAAPNARYQINTNAAIRTLDANGNEQPYLLTIRTADEEHEMIFVPGQNGLAQSDTLHFPAFVGDGASSLQIGFQAGYDPGSLTTSDVTLALFDRPSGIQQVDRGSVGPLDTIARQFAMIENTVADANGGLNPLGLAKDAVLFDIDPTQYANTGFDQPAGHFEQIWERARRAVINARNVFDGSTSMLNATRANLESLESFTADVRDRDLDYRNRLIEIFGTPHEANIGTGKPYPAGYSGPDLFFHPYVDVTDVTKDTVPAPPSNSRVLETQYKGFKSGIINSAPESGEKARNYFNDIVTKFFDADLPDFARLQNIDNTSINLKFPIAAAGYSFAKPAAWGNRAVTGELQILISDLVQAEAAVHAASADYQQFEAEVEAAIDAVEARYSTAVSSLDLLYKERQIIAGLAITRSTLQAASLYAQSAAGLLDLQKDAVIDSTPDTVIAGTAAGGDVLKPAVGLATIGLDALKAIALVGQFSADTAALAVEPAFELANYNVAISDSESSLANEIRQQLLALKAMLSQEKGKRLAIFMAVESMRQASDAYRSKVNVGLSLMAERADFNRSVAAQVQKHRYQDMTFRLFRVEALDAYHAAFDLASRYSWLAGKAYAYETNLPDTHPGSATPILESIVGERLIGDLTNGEPVLGSGLGNWLALMRDNYSVIKNQLGLNNGQNEDSRISLRAELFRKRSSSDLDFRAELATFRHADLNLVPEFRRFCRPFAVTTTTQPGLVIPMPTTITAGQNLFGMPLGPGDHAFDPSLFATKVRAVGVWFEGYDQARFAAAPRVYLVPAGNDAMLEPTSTSFEPTWWNVVDQRIPVPHLMGSNPLSDRDWSPVINTLDGPVGEIRKFSSFRAYSGLAGAGVNDAEMSFDSRLVGRSVWNDRWLLIIPGQTLGANAPAILDEFLGTNGIKDIHVVFKTTGFSGN